MAGGESPPAFFFIMAGVSQWMMNPIGNLLNLFNTSNDGNGTIWNHNNGYESSSFTEAGNQNAGNFGLDPDGLVSGLWNDWMGFTSQSREFSQQEYLQDKMNAYNTPLNQMKRMTKAGINPLNAAAAVAGSGSESAQAPSVASNQNGVQNGVASAAQMIASLGSSAAGFAEAAFKQGTLKPTIDKLNSEFEKNLVDKGFTEQQIDGLITDNKYRGENWEAEINLKRLQADDFYHQWQNLEAQYQLLINQAETEVHRWELLDSQAGEATAHANYLEALNRKTSLEADWMKIRVDFWKERGFDILSSSVDMVLVQMIENGKPVDELCKELIRYYGDREYEVGKGEQKAIRDYAQSIAFRRQRGESIASTRYDSPKSFSEAFWKVVQGMDNTLNKELSAIYKRFMSHPDNAKEIRRNLAAALGELSGENVMMDDPDVQNLINEITDLLQFSDFALEQYFKNLGK